MTNNFPFFAKKVCTCVMNQTYPPTNTKILRFNFCYNRIKFCLIFQTFYINSDQPHPSRYQTTNLNIYFLNNSNVYNMVICGLCFFGFN